MTELKQNVLDALDELLDSDELMAAWDEVNTIYNNLYSLFEEDDTEELED